MRIAESSLYHQIHPGKIATDWVSTIPSLYILWYHQLILGLSLAIGPSVIASVVIIRYADLEKQKQSRLGRYITRYMTKAMQVLRIFGFGLMLFGAWFHALWFLIPFGLVLITLAWLRGKILP